MFRKNNSASFISFLKGIVTQQSRTLLLTGASGWGKTACALDLSELILRENPLTSSNCFYFRNDDWALKTEFFLTKSIGTSEAWTWLYLLQRRISIIPVIEEHFSLPTGIKLTSIKEQLDEYIIKKSFPQDSKFIDQLIQFAYVLNKKSGIPINVIREAIAFHSVQSTGRVSILADFDTADPTTQNAALKLIEEPYPNHWLILTAQTEKNILPTILSRTLKIPLKKTINPELFGMSSDSSREIMKESVYSLSDTKTRLLREFFIQCSPNIEYGIFFIQFAEKLAKEEFSVLFLEELINCLEDGLRQRQSTLRNIIIPLRYSQYQEFSVLFAKATVAELEELVLQVESLLVHIRRSVVKDDYLLPNLLLDVSRTLRKIQ